MPALNSGNLQTIRTYINKRIASTRNGYIKSLYSNILGSINRGNTYNLSNKLARVAMANRNFNKLFGGKKIENVIAARIYGNTHVKTNVRHAPKHEYLFAELKNRTGGVRKNYNDFQKMGIKVSTGLDFNNINKVLEILKTHHVKINSLSNQMKTAINYAISKKKSPHT